MKSDIGIKLVLALIFTSCASFSQADSRTNILLELSEVKNLMGRSNVTLVDSRPLSNFKEGHILGAVSLPTSQTLANNGHSDLVASLQEIRDLLSHAGIQEHSHVVVYGDNMVDVSRLFWVLETFGIRKVAIMNGSYSEWGKAGYPMGTGQGEEVEKSVFSPALKRDKLATLLMVFAAINNEKEGLIDARPAAEYEGQQSRTAVYGHIPSAINIPWAKNLDKDQIRFRPISELKTLYKGLINKQMNTVYCNQGKKSAVSYVALRLLGAPVRSYDGSWIEWSQHPELPVTKAKKVNNL
ncbi:MAG: hypothetical protein CL866_07795 [Cycloclasticus sp.]|nr:hypothetical protein [Cycloclasticus sp.]MBG96749.1 hypothetical protein [Cycloclasticus sp.]|tara:strand:+ start:937 stop:1827 length:891 start_codon:yes stop_codon:yes gene_type:complete